MARPRSRSPPSAGPKDLQFNPARWGPSSGVTLRSFDENGNEVPQGCRWSDLRGQCLPVRGLPPAAVAATLAPATAQRCTQDCIQVHGVGFTWEHDTNVYHRRALMLAACFAVLGVSAAGGGQRDDAGMRP